MDVQVLVVAYRKEEQTKVILRISSCILLTGYDLADRAGLEAAYSELSAYAR